MNGVFALKRFLSFFFVSFVVLGLQSFTFVDDGEQKPTHGVIIVVDEIFLSVGEPQEPILVAGNPAANGDWVKVVGQGVITDFIIANLNGEPLEEFEVNSSQFKFQLDSFERGYYLMFFEMEGTVYTKTLLVNG